MIDNVLSWVDKVLVWLTGKPAVQAAVLQVAVALAGFFGFHLSAVTLASVLAALAALLGGWVHLKTRKQVKAAKEAAAK